MENKIMDTYLKPKKRPLVSIFFTKILVSLILFFASLIFVNINSFCKENYKKYVFDNTFNFMDFRNLYNKVIKNEKKEQLVFGEDLKYLNIEKAAEKEIITLYNTDIIKAISSGIVVFIGEKEDFGNAVIVQGADGYDIWYGNLESNSLTLYDYVKTSNILGNVKDNKLFLKIVKDGEEFSYEEYQNKN